MPIRALIDGPTGVQLNKLASVVRFEDVVRAKYYDKGEYVGEHMLDRNGMPVNISCVRASLFEDRGNGKTGRMWCTAEGGDRETALKRVMEKSKTQSRPASTAEELAQQLEEAQARIATLEHERSGDNGSSRSNVSSLLGRTPPRSEPKVPAETAPEPIENGDPGPMVPRKRGRGRPRKPPPQDTTNTEPQAS